MPGKIVCVRFGEVELAGLDALCRDLGAVTHSWAIRAAVSSLWTTRAMKAGVLRIDNADEMRYDQDDLPEQPSLRGRSEPGAETPPSVPGLPSFPQNATLRQMPETDPSPVITAEGTITPAIDVPIDHEALNEIACGDDDEWMAKIMAGKE